ncbi:hypothetical protein KUV07_000647 [Escherichia coli]|nr:hypothetical protein [Escherichia coli O2]EHQ5613016.1 hypothetical protein [Escherichia coli O2]EHQ6742239.1 hypothetical protein [Escherichia coli O2]EHR8378209.1 hypothetical protein [Escherichia coli]EHS0336415.1 hypothetical protein [Escherichia coli]
MAKNDFKAFATGKNANVMSQEEWEALPALLSGFTAGKASSAQVNKVIRQASFIAAALAQFVSDKTQRDVLDNGDLPGFVELLGSGFAVEYLSRKNPFGDIKSDGTVKTALENLGLGDGTGRLIAVYRIDTSRQITLPKDARFVVADLIGGGGGGGSNSTTVQPGYASAGQGGSSGSRVVAKFTVDASQKINITIGAGGAGGVPTPATGANGSDGGATIIDGITATGGRGGAKGAAFNVLPTGGPTASPNANNTIPGGAELIAQHHGYGGNSGFLFSDKNALGGKGADSEFGVGGVAIGISSGVNASAGNNARGNGSGGSGAVSIYGSGSTGVSMSGGAGADGLAILWVYG